MVRRRRKPVQRPAPPPKTEDEIWSDNAEQRLRCVRQAEFDQLPADVRAAINDCPFYLHVRRPHRIDMKLLMSDILAVKTEADARRFYEKWDRGRR